MKLEHDQRKIQFSNMAFLTKIYLIFTFIVVGSVGYYAWNNKQADVVIFVFVLLYGIISTVIFSSWRKRGRAATTP